MTVSGPAFAEPRAGSGSIALNLMRLRTFIALIAVLVFFLVCRTELSLRRKPNSHAQARRAECVSRDRNDIR
jgi:hypothetical protein